MTPDAVIADDAYLVREHGLHVAIDDVGIDHFELKAPSHLPISVIKIDKSAIDDFPQAQTSTDARRFVSLGRHLGSALRSRESWPPSRMPSTPHWTAQYVQGFLYGGPAAAEEFAVRREALGISVA